jgi:peptide/nickel transport system substrate-binding protein
MKTIMFTKAEPSITKAWVLLSYQSHFTEGRKDEIMKNRMLKLCIFVLLIGLLLDACGPATTPASTEAATNQPSEVATSQPTEVATAQPAEPKILTISFLREWTSLNPMYDPSWYSKVTQQIWNCDPWINNEKGEMVPVLTTEIPSLDNGGVSADGKTITIHLREDIKWSDGEPITADDFVFTWQMFTSPANTATAFPYNLVTSMTAVDPKTAVLTFDAPYIPWRATILREILPQHILKPVFDANGTLDNAEWNLKPSVGCGPYVFSDWESGSYTHFVRNTNYYDAPPKFDEVYIRIVPDVSAQTTALVNGDVQVGLLPPYSELPILKDAGILVDAQSAGYNEGWFANVNNTPAMQDVKVRQAVAMCLDRFSYVKDALAGATYVAASFWEGSPWQDPSLQPWPYDPEQAKQLLEQDGWTDSNGDGVREKNGVDLELHHVTINDTFRMDYQAVAQQNLAECGIKLDIASYPINDLLGSGQNSPCFNADFCQWGWAPSFPDGDTNRLLCSSIPSDSNKRGRNLFRMCDPYIDELFTEEISQLDPNQRLQTFYELSRYMTRNVYFLGLYNDPDFYAYNPILTGVKFAEPNPFFNISEWDLKQ